MSLFGMCKIAARFSTHAVAIHDGITMLACWFSHGKSI